MNRAEHPPTKHCGYTEARKYLLKTHRKKGRISVKELRPKTPAVSISFYDLKLINVPSEWCRPPWFFNRQKFHLYMSEK